MLPLKRVGRFSGGTGFPIAAQGNVGGEILFAKVSDMNRTGNEREIVAAANTVSSEVASILKARVFGPGTIIFPKVGEPSLRTSGGYWCVRHALTTT